MKKQGAMLTARVPKSLLQQVKRTARKNKQSQGQFVRETLAAALANPQNDGAAAPQEKTPVRQNEIAAA